MSIEFDAAKRLATLAARSIDMADAALVFEGPTLTVENDRRDYGEIRFITIGLLKRRMVVVVWTQRGALRRIISMRKANDREKAFYAPRLR